jgi:hypothetical protein
MQDEGIIIKNVAENACQAHMQIICRNHASFPLLLYLSWSLAEEMQKHTFLPHSPAGEPPSQAKGQLLPILVQRA